MVWSSKILHHLHCPVKSSRWALKPTRPSTLSLMTSCTVFYPRHSLRTILFVDVELWDSLCSGVIGLKWTLWVCPHTEPLFVMSVSWGNQNTLSWLPQRGDIIAQAVRDLYHLDLRKPFRFCSDILWIAWCHLEFIWWCSWFMGSFWTSEFCSMIIIPLIIYTKASLFSKLVR